VLAALSGSVAGHAAGHVGRLRDRAVPLDPPISCGDMVLAKLAAAAVATTLAWAIVLMLTPIWLTDVVRCDAARARFGRTSAPCFPVASAG
jgi:hypothetical protein